MGRLTFFLLLSASFLFAQNDAANTDKHNSNSNGPVTVQGCVDRARGDYILVKQNPTITYQLQGSKDVKLRNYLGQRVEVTGTRQTSLSTSSDSLGVGGSAAPVTIRVSSIKTLDKQCSERQVER